MTEIDGVRIQNLRLIPDGRGYLQEIMRNDSPLHDGFEWGQVYISAVYKDIVKAWHLHTKQTDFVCCIKGMIKLALYDSRDGSPTKGCVNIFYIGEQNPMLIRIPKGVYHGWKGLTDISLVLNIPDKMYDYVNPDEQRLSPNQLAPNVWGIEMG